MVWEGGAVLLLLPALPWAAAVAASHPAKAASNSNSCNNGSTNGSLHIHYSYSCNNSSNRMLTIKTIRRTNSLDNRTTLCHHQHKHSSRCSINLTLSLKLLLFRDLLSQRSKSRDQWLREYQWNLNFQHLLEFIVLIQARDWYH